MVELRDITAARDRLAAHLALTPCAPSEAFGEMFGGHAYFKLENLQRTGSFKERGALNRMLLLTAAERAAGVVAASAGNHAQGVAFHAGRLGVKATIVMPERTPLIKVSNTERFGARVVLFGNRYDEAMEEALRIREREGSTLIHPFDDPLVIAGQGTIGLELLEQCPRMDIVVVPVGGGGLVSGIALAIKSLNPAVRVVGVEAESYASALRSRQAGELVTIPAGESIADGISVRRVGETTFAMMERYVDDLVTVREEEISSAVLLLLEQEKVVAEPAAATVLAAVIGGQLGDLSGKHVAMVVSGGNIDVNLLSRIIDRGLINDGRLALLDLRVADRPGALAALTRLIADRGANILHLGHHRGIPGLWITEVKVSLTLETRGPEHVQQLIEALTAEGYSVHQS